VRLEITRGGVTERRRGHFAFLEGADGADVVGFTEDGERVLAKTSRD
jgi:hypothetical protein